ncbi:hypothetical protein B5K11_24715 [Rhizobium leguminosarum bv. trifolii]|nr:hypothetical protein B5K11_24715 [Rhizobium leguminosarum bv. trifolii]
MVALEPGARIDGRQRRRVVFPENFAAGLSLADQSLLLCGLKQGETGRIITTLSAELNPDLRDRVGI